MSEHTHDTDPSTEYGDDLAELFPEDEDGGSTLVVFTDRDIGHCCGPDDWSVAELNATERRIALYWSEQPLTPDLRGNRARMVEIITDGVAVAGGRVELFEVAEEYREIVRHVHVDRCPDCARFIAHGWPDRRRARLSRSLAYAPVWDQPWGRR